MREGKPALLYGTPTGGFPRPGWVVSMRAIELATKRFDRHPSDFSMRTGPVQMARSQLAAGDFLNPQHSCSTDICPGRFKCQVDGLGQCLACGKLATQWTYDYHLQHDDDLDVMPVNMRGGSPVDSFLELFESDPQIGVVGAVYLREAPQVPTIMVKDKEYGREWNSQNAIGGWPNEPFEVDGIGTGFIMVRREVIEQIVDGQAGDVFRFTDNKNPFGVIECLGEDYEFCQKARALGWKVVADPRVPTKHIKQSGVLMYETSDWYRKCHSTDSPMQLSLGDTTGGARIVHQSRTTIWGTPFEMACVDMYETKRLQGEELKRRKAERLNAAGA